MHLEGRLKPASGALLLLLLLLDEHPYFVIFLLAHLVTISNSQCSRISDLLLWIVDLKFRPAHFRSMR